VAKLIAIEWDRRELRLLAGSRRGTQLQVENAVTVSLPNAAEDDNAASQNITGALGQALNSLKVAKCEAIVSVGRANVELRTLQLPVAEEDDLPDMVRFQAMKQFASLTEATPLDFVVMPPTATAGGDSGLSVLAASLSTASVKEIQKQCSEAGVEVQKIVLRPFAVAQLLQLADSELRKQNLLMVDILGDEADLTIVENGQVVFIRSVKLPSEDETVVGPWLVGEMRRTLMAAAGQRNGLKVDQVLVWAHQSVADSLSDRAANQLQLPIQVIDPFTKVRLDDSAKTEISGGRKSRFTPLLGVLVAEAAGTRQVVDFLSPRRRPPKKRPIGRYALAGSAAAAVLIAGAWWYRSTHTDLDYQIAELKKTSKGLDQMVVVAQQNVARWKAVEQFVERDVNWLDEMSRMAQKLPPSKDIIVRDTTFLLSNNEKSPAIGQINTSALIRSIDVGPTAEQNLRDTIHKVEGKPAARSTANLEGYPWLVSAAIAITGKEQKPAKVTSADAVIPPAKAATVAPVAEAKDAEAKPENASVKAATTAADESQNAAVPAAESEVPASEAKDLKANPAPAEQTQQPEAKQSGEEKEPPQENKDKVETTAPVLTEETKPSSAESAKTEVVGSK